MAPQVFAGSRAGAGRVRPVLAVACLLWSVGALAEEPSANAPAASPGLHDADFAPAALVAEWEQGLADAALFDTDFSGSTDAYAAPASELAEGVDVQVAHKRRKFRAKAVDWMSERSTTMGHMTDLLLGGGDSGFHLVVDPTGQDEYILEWKARFR